jgi:hypothetical protein
VLPGEGFYLDVHWRNDNAHFASPVMEKWRNLPSSHRPAGALRRRLLTMVIGISAWPWSIARSIDLRAPETGPLAPPYLGSGVLAALAGDDGVDHVGAIYLAAHPHEAEAGRLMHLIGGDRRHTADRAVAQRIDLDWRRQDITLIDGWVFSRTEARLCALLYLGRPTQ